MPIYMPYKRSFILVMYANLYAIQKIIYPSYLRRRMVGGADPLCLKFWVIWTRWSEIADY